MSGLSRTLLSLTLFSLCRRPPPPPPNQLRQHGSPAVAVDSWLVQRMAEATPEADPPPQLSWSDIPLDLAGLVLRRLPAHVDRVRFAAVCPQWRSAARHGPLPPPLPLLALQDGTVYSLPRSEPFRLPACAGYADSCGGNWLFFPGEDGCFLRDPLFNVTVTLPAKSRTRVHFADDEAYSRSWRKIYEGKEMLNVEILKVIFCSPNLVAALVCSERIDGIAICKPGATSWWSLYMDSQSQPWDIAFHRGKLYAFDRHQQGHLLAIDISVDHNTDNPYISRIQRVISGIFDFQTTFVEDLVIYNTAYLVQSRGALLMVYRKIYGVWAPLEEEGDTFDATGHNEFQVFQADFDRLKWTNLTTIGQDQVLFLRRWCSSFVLVSQKEIPGDCIVFVENDHKDLGWYDTENSSSCSAYNMKDGSISTILPTVSWKWSTVPPTWLFPQD